MLVCWLGDFRHHTHTPQVTKEPILVMNPSDTTLSLPESTTLTTTTTISTKSMAKTRTSFGTSESNLMTFYADGNYLHLELTGDAGEQWVAAGFSKNSYMASSQFTSLILSLK